MPPRADTAPGAPPLTASGRGGAVATAHWQATDAALAVLERGGNAMDAAVCAAAMLGVVQPMMSGLGGDSFILWRDGASGSVHAIDGAGPAPRALTLAWAERAGLRQLPERGLVSAAVPGAPDAMWLALQRFGSGRLSMAQLLEPAIAAAADGAVLAPVVARFFAAHEAAIMRSASVREAWACEGGSFAAGAVLRQPDLARTLEMFASQGPDAFYRGTFARRLAEFSRASGGLFAFEDMAAYHAESVEPIALRFGKAVVHTNPPVAQGVVLLQALGILQCLRRDGAAEPAPLRAHRMVEALKLAFTERNRHFGDPRHVANPLGRALAAEHIARRAGEIRDDSALQAQPGVHWSLGEGDTTAFTVADGNGNAVSYITSLSTPFGALEIVPGTGVLLGNRAGRGFSLDPASPNAPAPGKRTMSTLHAYIATTAHGRLWTAGGTSGGDGQPQWNLQMLDAMLEHGMRADEAVAMPRWELFPGTDPATLGQPYEIRVDPRLDPQVAQGLRERGHHISDKPLGLLGAAQVIALNAGGAYLAAADPRADGSAGAIDPTC